MRRLPLVIVVFLAVLTVVLMATGERGPAAVAAGPTITQYPLPNPGSGPYGIAPGPDGALWFTETGGNQIGRITTGGAISEYPTPTARAASIRSGASAPTAPSASTSFPLAARPMA